MNVVTTVSYLFDISNLWYALSVLLSVGWTSSPTTPTIPIHKLELARLPGDVKAYLHNDNSSLSAHANHQCKPKPNAKWLWNSTEIMQDRGIPQYDWIGVYRVMERNISIPPTPAAYVFDIPSNILKTHWSKTIPLSHSLSGLDYNKVDLDAMLDELFLTAASFKDKHVLLLNNVIVDNWGLIVHLEDCTAVRNGACRPASEPFAGNPTSKQYPLVITIATSWTGTWHFPMEDLVALAYIDEAIVREAVIHIPYRSTYLEKWLSVIGVDRSRVVTGSVGAKVLLVPQLAMCGKPYLSQLSWLRNKLLTSLTPSLVRSPSTTNHSMPSLRSNHTSAKGGLIVFIERSDHRDLKSKEKAMLKSIVSSYAEELHMRIIVHDGKSDSLSIAQQVEPFVHASIVVGEHGAGLMFASFAPRDACIIEISSARNPLCYARLAFLNKQHYIMLHFEDKLKEDEVALRTALSKCHSATSKQSHGDDK